MGSTVLNGGRVMQLKFAFLCDYAEEAGGKLHAVGIGWDTIYARTLPVAHPMMCFVAVLKGTIAETGTKNLALRLIDADGNDVVPPLLQQAHFVVRAPALEGDIKYVAQLGSVQISKLGSYAVHLTVDGNELANVPFSVSAGPTTAENNPKGGAPEATF
jgi:hypothetical protein